MTAPASRWQRPAFIAVTAVMLLTTGAFYYFWRAGYSSDTAMGPLMAKSVLERGERPIFYWQVGYQGTLEVYATALFFKLFGMGPRVANLWQMLCFWAMQALFFLHLRKVYDFWIALWSSLMLTLGSPWMYLWAMRTLPNYTETFVMGLALFMLGQGLIEKYYVQATAPALKHTWRLWAAFGAVFGFGLYTYGQIVFFVGAIAAQLFFMLVRELPGRVRWRGFLGAVLGVAALPVVWGLGVALSNYLGDVPTAAPFSTRMASVDALKQGVVLAVAWLALLAGVAFPRALWRLLPGAGVMLATFLVGWSPQLYFTYVVQAPARNRTALSGTLDMAMQRWGWGWDGLKLFFGVSAFPYTSLIIGLLVLLPLLAYGAHVARSAWRFVRKQTPRAAVLTPGVLAWLPLILFPMFTLAHAVEDIWSTRYLMAMWFWFSAAYGWAAMTLWRRQSKNRSVRIACVLAATIMVVHHGAFLAQRIYQDEQKGFTGEKAIPALRERGIKYGYAWYWYAYAIDFYTQEEIILEPIASAYCPHYRPLVQQATRFAFMDDAKTFRQHLQMMQHYWGGNVRVTDVWEQDDIAFAVLER